MRTSNAGSPIDVGSVPPSAVNPAAGPKLIPVIVKIPPAETLLGAGCTRHSEVSQ